MTDRFKTRTLVKRSNRATEWTGSAVDTDVGTLNAASLRLDQSFTATADETIVRTRGTLWVGSDQQVATETPFGAMGMCVVSDPAIAIGVTAMPAPYTDLETELWYLWFPWLCDFRLTSTFVAEFNTLKRYDFDSKAMRKISEGESIAVLIENGSAADAVSFLMIFRILVKLRS